MNGLPFYLTPSVWRGRVPAPEEPVSRAKAMRFVSWFAGIGGFELGLERAGHRCVAACEIDPHARRIYAKRFGRDPEFVDIRAVNPDDIPDADLWCGGFPCQDVSVAGKRAGIGEGTRSGLWWTWQRLVAARRPRWLLIENVPGLLSSNAGADFVAILRSLDEIGYVGAWRILDARHFGVPQRRRRVFLVAHLGDGDPGAVLFEPEGVRGDPATGGAAGAGVVGSLAGCSRGGGWRVGSDEAAAGHVVAQQHGSDVGAMGALRAGHGDVQSGVPFVMQESQYGTQRYDDAGSLRAGRLACGDSYAVVSSNGHDHWRDGVGMVSAHAAKDGEAAGLVVGSVQASAGGADDNDAAGGRLVPFTVSSANSCERKSHARPADTARCLDGTGGFADQQGGTVVAIESPGRKESGAGRVGDGVREGGPMYTLDTSARPHGVGVASAVRASDGHHGHGAPRGDAGDNLVVAGAFNSTAESGRGGNGRDERVTPPVRAGGVVSGSGTPAVAFQSSQSGVRSIGDRMGSLDANYGSRRHHGVVEAMVVRRLTPTECERLMGLPDGHTCTCGVEPYSTETCRCPDGPRYGVLGNSVVVPVIEWIGRRLLRVG